MCTRTRTNAGERNTHARTLKQTRARALTPARTRHRHQKRHYLCFINLIPWIMITATFMLILPFETKPCVMQWRGAWISLLLAWINFIMYLRRLNQAYALLSTFFYLSLFKLLVITFLLFINFFLLYDSIYYVINVAIIHIV